MVRIDFKLADIKVESSEVYLLKLGKICVRFVVYILLFTFCCKNVV